MSDGHDHREFLEMRARKGTLVTLIGLMVNLALSLFKLAAGVLGRSSAMVADAFHSLSDLATDVLVLICFIFVRKEKDEVHRYGHGKIETVISGLIGLALFMVGLGIAYSSFDRIIQFIKGDTISPPGWIALVAAVLSIIIKEALYIYTSRIGKKIRSEALRSNAWHHRSDALSSIGTLIGISGAILLGGRWAVLDPVAALGVSGILIWISIRFIRSSLTELTEASLDPETEEKLVKMIEGTHGVRGYHDLRTRKIGTEIAMDVHVTVDEGMTIEKAHDIADSIEERIRGSFGNGSMTTIHMEPHTRERALRSKKVLHGREKLK